MPNSKMMLPEELKYMEMIQVIITRMNTNSFQIKNFMMLILSACLVAFVNAKNGWILVSFLPVVILIWIIDSYYLQQERKFRGLYNELVEDFTSHKLFSMKTDKIKGREYYFISAMFLSINSFLYLAILSLIITLKLLTNY